MAIIQNSRVSRKDQELFLMAFESVQRWLNGLRNPTTKRNYVLALFLYCRENQMTPDQLIKEKEASLRNPNLRGVSEDRLNLWHRKKERTAPGRAICTFKAIKSFFKANYVPVGAKTPIYVPQREQTCLPTKDKIRSMCEIAPSLEVKTIILFLAESGQRIGTLTDLRLRYIKEGLANYKQGEPFIFNIPQKRNKYGKLIRSKRIYGMWGFACDDAVEALKLLIKTKNITDDDQKLFPLESQRYSKIISALAAQIGINPEGKGLKPFRAHNLRKMAQTTMEDSGIPLNWVDRILGHKPRGSQGDTYSLPPKEKLAEKYKLAMRELQIYKTIQYNLPKIQELEKRISQLESIIATRL